MTPTKAMRLASLVTAIDVLVASGFSIAAIIRPQYLVPAESVPTEASLLLAMYAAARTVPLALFALGAIYKQATPALLILGALAALYRRAPIPRAVSASPICTDHAANRARISARYGPALPSSPQLRGEADAARHSAVISHSRTSGACAGPTPVASPPSGPVPKR
jgi:hypothetical protein